MDIRADAARTADRSTRQEFVERYGHAFLAIRIETDSDQAGFMTVVDDAISELELTPPPSPTTALIGELLCPLLKRPGANQFSFITIGRAANNDIVVPLNSVSKCHAVIHTTASGYTIADAGSENGSFLNGVVLAPHDAKPFGNGDTATLANRVTVSFMDAVATYAWLRKLSPR